MKILIVEDEPSLRELMQRTLEKERYVVEVAATYGQALQKIEDYSYDCILLDIMLPGADGFEVYQTAEHVPTIFLTAKGGLSDRVRGLRMGADDYIVKPFEMKELMARINAVLRRSEIPDDTKKKLVFDKLIINLDSYELIVDGKVYGREEGVVESGYTISARVGGHAIETEFTPGGKQLLRVDGQVIAKKQRLF